MTWQIAPVGNEQFFTTNGVLAVGYQLFTYMAGTTTKVATAAAFDGSSNQTNPIILNSNGLPPSPIYLDINTAYKFVYALPTDTDPPASPVYTVDNITVQNLSVAFSEWLAGTTPTYINGTQFSVAGDQRTIYHVGRRVKLVASGSTVYGVISVSAFTTVTTLTVLIDNGLTISASLNSVFYGLLSASGSSWPNGFDTGLLKTFVVDEVIRTSTPSVRLIGTEASGADYLVQESAGLLQTYLNTGTETSPIWTGDNAFFMPGDIKEAAYSVADPGWSLCDGGTLSRTGSGARLFARIGTTFGIGDGSTTFNKPDRRGRAGIGLDGGVGRITAASLGGANGNTLGGSGGEEVHTLVASETPVLAIRVSTTAGGAATEVNEITTSSANASLSGKVNIGGGGAHNNTQPWIAMNYFIKL